MSDPLPVKTATALPGIEWGAWLDEDGEIRWVAPPADNLPPAVREMADSLHANFALGTGSWLLALANRSVGSADAPWLQFWHRMVHLFLHRVLVSVRAGREIEGTVDLPPQGNWLSFVEAMPMVPQLQRATPALLETVWRRLGHAFKNVITAQGGDALAALSVVDPLWARTGMLTFHLAENRQSQEFPFAFVATYAQRQANGRVVLLPLAQILRQAAQSGDQALLLGILQPLQKAVQGHPFLAELVESRGVFGALAWTAGEAHEFLTASPVLTEAGIALKIPDWWKGKKGNRPMVQVQMEANDGEEKKTGTGKMGAGSVVRFDVTVALGGKTLTAEEIEAILASEAPLVSLKGQWVEVDKARLQKALALWRQAAAAHANGIPFHVGLRWLAVGGVAAAGALAPGDPQVAEWTSVTGAESFTALLETLRQPPQPVETVPGLQASLRTYQKTGVSWLWQRSRLGLGSCLADDMGLGKTIQVIALLLLHRAANRSNPSLIVAPASLLGNWRQEFAKFAPSYPVITAHRSQLSAAEMSRIASGQHSALRQPGVVLTTYGMASRLVGLREMLWDCIILDEAQAIKNAQTTQAAAVRELQGDFRLAMTGTPVENRLDDLWSLFHFLNPGLLGSAEEFARLVRQLAESETGYAPLRRLVHPLLLRRMKTDPDVAPDLPAKTEMTAWCSLTKRQATLYQRAVSALAKQLATAADQTERQAAVLGVLLKLKQICDHPSLWSGDGAFQPSDSGKYERLAEICRTVRDCREKVLIFTQFREMTERLAEFLADVFGCAGLVLHGATPVSRRAELVSQFQSPEGPPFFVISLKAGGTGLNLTAASHVIHFDRWWNPAVEDQATDRAYRIGQKRAVLVHKFVCQGTLEEKISALIEDKKALANEILSNETGTPQMLLEMGDAELMQFLGFRGGEGE